MKWIRRILFIVIFSIISESFVGKINNSTANLIFGVIGIMFPMAISQILSFPFSNIDNKKYIEDIQSNLHTVIRYFIVLLFLALFLVSKIYPDHAFKIWIFSFSIYGTSNFLIAWILAYYCINFYKLVLLQDKLNDKLREFRLERENREKAINEIKSSSKTEEHTP